MRKYFQPLRWPHHSRAGQKNPKVWIKVCVLFFDPSESQTFIINYSYHLDLRYNITLILFITLQFQINPQGQHTWLDLCFAITTKGAAGHAGLAQPLTLRGSLKRILELIVTPELGKKREKPERAKSGRGRLCRARRARQGAPRGAGSAHAHSAGGSGGSSAGGAAAAAGQRRPCPGGAVPAVRAARGRQVHPGPRPEPPAAAAPGLGLRAVRLRRADPAGGLPAARAGGGPARAVPIGQCGCAWMTSLRAPAVARQRDAPGPLKERSAAAMRGRDLSLSLSTAARLEAEPPRAAAVPGGIPAGAAHRGAAGRPRAAGLGALPGLLPPAGAAARRGE